eukprot:TRINITY_DN3858_c0_g1_i1.p1 TRINITY_DN3858_c0_g1~~TRINITY_DN3858_c0_g1_i1.p1  ORF type:complete len:235 (-),score=66.33 TRINITY_DN3858_c0_g1_i1:45-749(-)
MANVFKKAAPRREHRERHQPEARKRLGLLEKKKDYKQRAGDYHRKEKKIQSLREKAAMKNPDEFYYGMLNSKTQGGVHVKEREEKYSNEELHLMKSQDLTYVEMKKTEEMKRIEKLSANLHCFDEDFSDDESGPSSSSSSRRHIVFVDNEKEAESFDAAEYFDTLPELVSRKYNRPRVSQLQKDDFILGVKYVVDDMLRVLTPELTDTHQCAYHHAFTLIMYASMQCGVLCGYT